MSTRLGPRIEENGAAPWAIPAWAVYLAVSWTWCIGMFFPVLIMRELGFTGVIVFALPNILGAAAMGWIIRTAARSCEIVADHRAACIWFSLVTIIYHAFFAAWIIRKLAGPAAGFEIIAAFLFFWAILKWRAGGEFLAVLLALAVTAAVMAWGFQRGDLPYLAHPVEGTRLPPIDNLFLAPAWIFGFLCCPYLDLTFHAARQALSRTQARVAFTLSFAGIFPLMLLLTVAYSGWLAIGFDRIKYPQLALILSAHFIVQSCVTCALHAEQIARVENRLNFRRFLAFSVLLIVAVLFGILDRPDFTYNGFPLGEIVYRAFMGFYGLFAPAYVWLRLIRPKRSILRVWAVVIIAAPMYWLGFADERMPFILPGILIIIASKFLPEI
jgi:hypothetical protein